MLFLGLLGLILFLRTPLELLPSSTDQRFVIIFQHNFEPEGEYIRNLDNIFRTTFTSLNASIHTQTEVHAGWGISLIKTSEPNSAITAPLIQNLLSRHDLVEEAKIHFVVDEIRGGSTNVMELVVTTKNRSAHPVDFRNTIENKLIPSIREITGVKQVTLKGVPTTQYQLTPKPDLVHTAQRPLSEITRAVVEALQPPIPILPNEKSVPLWSRNQHPFHSKLAQTKILVGNDLARQIELSELFDIAIERETTDPVRLNREPALLIDIHKHSNGNDVDISNAIRMIISKFSSENQNLTLDIVSDKATYVRAAQTNVLSNLVMGIVLTSLCVLFFVRSFRFTAIIASGIPVALLLSFLFLDLLEISRNVMSLAGLALSVGMCVDGSVTILDSFRKNTEMKKTPKQAAALAVSENFVAVLLTSCTTLAVFIPILFLTGLVGDLFRDLALTMITSQVVSLAVATLYVPTVASFLTERMPFNEDSTLQGHIGKLYRFLRPSHHATKFSQFLLHTLSRILETSILYRTVALSSLFATLWSLTIIPDPEFLPKRPTADHRVLIPLSSTTTPAKAAELIERLDTSLEGFSATKRLIRLTMEGIEADFTLPTPLSEKHLSWTETILNRELAPHSCVMVAKNPLNQEANLGKDVTLFLDNRVPADLTLDPVIQGVPGVVKHSWGFNNREPRASLIISDFSVENTILTSKFATTILNLSYGNNLIGLFPDPSSKTWTKVFLKSREQDPPWHAQIPIHLPGPTLLPFVEEISARPQSATLVDGVPVQRLDITVRNRTNDSVAAKLTEKIMAMGREVHMGEAESESGKSLSDLQLCLGIATIIVGIILFTQNKSIGMTSIILVTFVWGAIGSIPGLVIHGESLNASALVGFILLAGTIVNNGIILADIISRFRRQQYSPRDCCIEAIKVRTTPVLITAFTTAFGMLPMVFDTGEGSQMYRGLSIVVVYGILISTPVSLVGIPSLFMIANDIREFYEELRLRILIWKTLSLERLKSRSRT